MARKRDENWTINIKTTQTARKHLLIGLFGAFLTLIGDPLPAAERKMPHGAEFYKLSMYGYLAIAGGAVHLPCGVSMWLYHLVAEAAGQEAGYNIALQYVLYFILPVTIVFSVFFAGNSVVQFIAVIKGCTPFPKVVRPIQSCSWDGIL